MHVCFVQWQGYSLIYSPQMLQSLSSMRWRGHVTYTRDMRNENKILSFYHDKLNDRDTLGTLIGQYIKLDFTERRWEGYVWTHLSKDTVQWLAFVNMTMNPWVPQKAEHFVPSSGPIITLWQTLIHGVCYLIWWWINNGEHSCLYSRCSILLCILVSAV